MKRHFVVLALAAVFTLPSLTYAATILDTGTPTQFSAPLIISSNASVAVEFAVTQGETLQSLSLYLTPNSLSQPNGFVTLSLYSVNLTNTAVVSPVTQFQLQYTASGWNTANVNYTIPTTGNYWFTLQTSGSNEYDAPEEATQPTGTAPAIEFAQKGSREYSPSSTVSFGIQVTATPEPSTWALVMGGLGLLALGSACAKRKVS
jgi:PEP-CTERM motif